MPKNHDKIKNEIDIIFRQYSGLTPRNDNVKREVKEEKQPQIFLRKNENFDKKEI